MSETVVVTSYDGWAEVRINREEKRNAVNRATRRGLLEAFAQLTGSAKAIVLTGTSGSFCAGIDLKEVEQDKLAGLNIMASSEEWIAVILAIRAHPAIFIAAVNGIALGGGSTLINVSDLAVASAKASIGCPEIGFATYPGMSGPAAQLSGITRKQAAWMILTANRVDGATAARWGMVNECVEPDQLLPRAHEIAQGIARFDAVALAESKRAIDRIPAFITDWKQAMDHGQMVNETIRARTKAQDIGRTNFAAGNKNPGQGL